MRVELGDQQRGDAMMGARLEDVERMQRPPALHESRGKAHVFEQLQGAGMNDLRFAVNGGMLALVDDPNIQAVAMGFTGKCQSNWAGTDDEN